MAKRLEQQIDAEQDNKKALNRWGSWFINKQPRNKWRYRVAR
jgi:hypothetical protein